MKFVNLTPHDIVMWDKKGDMRVIERSMNSLRVSSTMTEIGEIDNIKLIKTVFSEIPSDDLDFLKKVLAAGNSVIVSMLAAKKLKAMDIDHKDRIFIIGHTVRNDKGVIVGADALTPITEV